MGLKTGRHHRLGGNKMIATSKKTQVQSNLSSKEPPEGSALSTELRPDNVLSGLKALNLRPSHRSTRTVDGGNIGGNNRAKRPIALTARSDRKRRLVPHG